MSKDYTAEALQRQATAARALLEDMREDVEGDEELVHDTVEGETDFFEAVKKALEEINDNMATQEGCAAMAKRNKERGDRAKRRAEKLRGLVDRAFQMAEVKSHNFNVATVTSKKIAPGLVVTDEAAIPSEYFKTPDPVLDKKKLLDAIKANKDKTDDDGKPISIPGAQLSNGGMTIQIKWT